MIVTPIPHGLTMGVSGGERSPGLHVSDIYTSLFTELAGEGDRTGWPEAPLQLAADGGFQLERSIESALLRAGVQAWRPGERLSPEGIVYSPDLFMLLPQDDGKTRIGEIKRKYMSSNGFPTAPATAMPTKIQKHVVQLMIYCHWEGTTLGRFFIEFVLGDYSRPYMPTLLAWDVEFTPRELAECYAMLMNHAKHKGMMS